VEDVLCPSLSHETQLPAWCWDSPCQLRQTLGKDLILEQEEKTLHTHLIPYEKEAREADERAESWAAFYSSPALPQAQRQPLGK